MRYSEYTLSARVGEVLPASVPSLVIFLTRVAKDVLVTKRRAWLVV